MRTPSAVLLFAVSGLPLACAAQEAFVEHNGSRYSVHSADGRLFYSDGARVFSQAELRTHVAAQRPRIIQPALSERLGTARAGEMIELTVLLRHQPVGPISREVFGRIEIPIAELARRMREISAAGLPEMSLPPAQEAGIIVGPPAPVARQARADLARLRDDLERTARLEIAARVSAAVAPHQRALAAEVARLGGRIVSRTTNTLSVMGVVLPAAQVARLAASPLVATIDINHPGQPDLDISALAVGVTTSFWANGIDGGTFDAGILDTGVQQNHPALASHTFISNLGVNDTQTHGTLMAGITASTDALNRGMAFGLDKIVVALAGDINTSMPGMDFIAGTGEPESCNYSFGNGTASTVDYSTTDQFFDGVIDTFGFMVAKSAGNGGFGSGAPTITFPAPAFNLMACANMNDANTAPRADDRISSSSSRGPTAGGRKKPDIGAPGTSVNSCAAGWATGNDWSSCTGTSCAAPHVNGAVVLLFDAGIPNVTAAKALLINTADAMEDNATSSTADDTFVAGSRWNRRYGWGYMNLAGAYLHLGSVFTGSVADEPENADFKLYSGQMFTNEKATLAWRRHVAYNGATFPMQIESLSNLDLTAWNPTSNAQVASSTSTIDNVEQFGAPADGVVVLKVESVGLFDPDVATEPFALAAQENFAARTGPAFTPALVHPPNVGAGANFTITANITNSGDLAAHGVSVTLSGVSIVSGPNPASAGTIGAGLTVPVSWTVQASIAAGPHPIGVSISSNSYGEDFAGSGSSTYFVGGTAPCYANCDGSTSAPVLNVNDFTCFLNRFAAGETYANCDGSTASPTLNVNDFTCFTNAYAAGCP